MDTNRHEGSGTEDNKGNVRFIRFLSLKLSDLCEFGSITLLLVHPVCSYFCSCGRGRMIRGYDLLITYLMFTEAGRLP